MLQSWIDQFNATPGIVAPGGVLLVLCGQWPADEWVGWWHVFIRCLVDGERPLYRLVAHAVPPTGSERDPAATLRRVVTGHLQNLGKQVSEAEKEARNLPAKSFKPGEVEALLEWLKGLPENSIVAVSCAERFRFPFLEPEPFAAVRNWTQITTQLNTPEGIQLPHIYELTRRVLEITRGRSLCVALFCETHQSPNFPLPADLEADGELAVLTKGPPGSRSASDAFVDLLRRVREEKIPSAEWDSLIEPISESPFERALMKANMFYIDGSPSVAWEVLSPHQADLARRPISDIPAVAQIALASGDSLAATTLVRLAIERGLEILEDLYGTYLIAEKLGIPEREGLRERLQAEFPDDSRVLAGRLTVALQEYRFDDAAGLARRLGMEFSEMLAIEFAKPELQPDAFFRRAHELGRSDEAWIDAAAEAKRRGLWTIAEAWAQNVALDGSHGEVAIILRIQFLARHFQEEDLNDAHLAELALLMDFVALHPLAYGARFELEDLFEKTLEEPVSEAILVGLVMNGIAQLAAAISQNVGQFAEPPFNPAEMNGAEEFKAFWIEFLAAQPVPGVVVGRGELPAHLKPKANRTVLGWLYGMVSRMKCRRSHLSEDLNPHYLALQGITQVARELSEPSADFLAARLFIAKLASATAYQQARDVAETTLIGLPQAQPEALIWRYAQGWFCNAEAFERSRNTLSALRCLALGLCISVEPGRSGELILGTLRLSARVLRNCGLITEALDVVRLEEEIRARTNMSPASIEFRQFRLLLELIRSKDETSPAVLLGYLKEASDILREASDELGPPLACMGNVLRMFRECSLLVPSEAEALFQEKLGQFDEPGAELIRAATANRAGREEVLAAIHAASGAETWEDLAYQLTPLRAMLHSAVSRACEIGDPDLFALAASAFSQPTLSMQASAGESPMTDFERALNRQAAISIGNRDLPEDEVARLLRHTRATVPRSARDFSGLVNVSLDDVRKALLSDESALVLVNDSKDRLCRMIVSTGNVHRPEQLEPLSWSEQRLSVWKRSYPYAYQDRNFTPDAVRASLEGLSPADMASFPRQVTIVPENELFGFPFSLTKSGEHFLGELTKVAVAPSLPWLVEQRRTLWEGRRKMCAWLGEPNTTDSALRLFRIESTPWLRTLGVQISKAPTPADLAHAAVAIVTAHGRLGGGRHFSAVTDTHRSFSPDELADFLEGCGCVVLCVCSGGRSDAAMGSAETHGLVPELLRRGTRAVVGPLWPIPVWLAQQWLEPFLRELRQGVAVGESAALAVESVRRNYPLPCEWGVMQVFGDQTFSPLA